MFFRLCLSLALLSSTTFAIGLKDYSDYKVLPAWSSTAFDALLKAKVISGTGSGELQPDATINRAEFTKILLEATDKPLIDPRPNTFNDVHPEHWFYKYIETAADLGWVTGYNNGSFKPGNTINRAEIAKLINKAFEIPSAGEPTDTTWYDAEVRALAKKNLLPYNVSKHAFGADRTPSRAEAFEQIYRALQYKYSGNTAPKNPSTVTKSDGSINSYDVAANFSLTMAVTPSAGRLDLKRPDSQAKEVIVNPGQKNITIAQLEMVARNGNVNLSDLQFRRIGNGSIADFDKLWLEVNNQPISAKSSPENDLVAINFTAPLTLATNRIAVLNLKADIASSAKIGNSERFVLYLPDWINANTNEKIGLFPLGGSDVEIR